MNAPEEKDPVWELLKKSPPPKASPLFSRNVVREARKQGAKMAGTAVGTARVVRVAGVARAGKGQSGFSPLMLTTWLRRPATAFATAALVAGLAAALIATALLRPGASFRDSGADAPVFAEAEQRPAPASVEDGIPLADDPHQERFDAAEEIGNIEYLGQLMAVADPAILDDIALADLFF